MSLLERVAANLHRERKARHLSQRELAERSGYSVSYISMLERGERSPPLPTLDKVAKALHVPSTDLVGGKKATRH